MDSPCPRRKSPAFAGLFLSRSSDLSLIKPLCALLGLVLLAGCAEINKPITPGDSWREKATSELNAPPR